MKPELKAIIGTLSDPEGYDQYLDNFFGNDDYDRELDVPKWLEV